MRMAYGHVWVANGNVNETTQTVVVTEKSCFELGMESFRSNYLNSEKGSGCFWLTEISDDLNILKRMNWRTNVPCYCVMNFRHLIWHFSAV